MHVLLVLAPYLLFITFIKCCFNDQFLTISHFTRRFLSGGIKQERSLFPFKFHSEIILASSSPINPWRMLGHASLPLWEPIRNCGAKRSLARQRVLRELATSKVQSLVPSEQFPPPKFAWGEIVHFIHDFQFRVSLAPNCAEHLFPYLYQGLGLFCRKLFCRICKIFGFVLLFPPPPQKKKKFISGEGKCFT